MSNVASASVDLCNNHNTFDRNATQHNLENMHKFLKQLNMQQHARDFRLMRATKQQAQVENNALLHQDRSFGANAEPMRGLWREKSHRTHPQAACQKQTATARARTG